MPLREEAQIINQLKLTKIDKLLPLIANYAGKKSTYIAKRATSIKNTIFWAYVFQGRYGNADNSISKQNCNFWYAPVERIKFAISQTKRNSIWSNASSY